MAGHLEVARTPDAIYIRVVGLGNFNNAGPMREYCEKAFEEGMRNVLVDLAQCTGLDSTFMGTWMGFANWESPNNVPVTVTIVNPAPPTLRAMNSLGIPKILHVRTDPVAFPDCKLQHLQEGWQDKKRRTVLIRDAHMALMQCDKENEARFAPFVAALVKEVRALDEQRE